MEKLSVLKLTSLKSQSPYDNFPVLHYTYSSLVLFGSNPILFKIKEVNHEYFESTRSSSSVLGSAVHAALKAYLGGDKDVPTPADEGEAILHGHAAGLKYLDGIYDGFIEWTSTIPDRAKLNEKYAFCYFGYVKEYDASNRASVISVEEALRYKVKVNDKELPIMLKGYLDLIFRDTDGKIVIDDHKITGSYSDGDKIDGAKLIQAAIAFCLTYAHTGEAPDRMRYREFKHTLNRDGSPQTKTYEIVFADYPLLFAFFYRYYEDVTRALLGEQVYVPNVHAMFDNEVAILSYIHRLDIEEDRAKQFKEEQVNNITDFLKKTIQKSGAMKKYLETVERKFISAKTLNYKDMPIEDRIRAKLHEYGIALQYEDKIVGGSVSIYRYEPSVGVKMKKIESFKQDIEQVVGISGIRILAPIPNTIYVGFEIPNEERTFPEGLPDPMGYEIPIGETVMREVRYFDIRTAPHMLIAGSTGSGKSVFLNTLITQLMTLPRAELHLFDPKQVELGDYEGKKNVVEYQSEPDKIGSSLVALVAEMEERYGVLKKMKLRNIDNTTIGYKFVIIDEFADLAMRGTVGDLIQKLAQKGRAAGIHLIIATQRASTQVISGDTKINFPVKVVFKMAKEVDSRVMIDEAGAEKLLGKGDMLFVSDSGTERLQGYSL